jgi:hypothetical protein
MVTSWVRESGAPQTEIKKISDVELAYAAGLIDGEGCITVDKPGGRDVATKYTSRNAGLILRVRMYNTNRLLIQFMADHFGGAVNGTHYKEKPHHLDQYYWQLLGKAAANFLQQILPFLVGKLTEAEAAILFAETLTPLWKRARTLLPEASTLRRIAVLSIRQAKARGSTRARAAWAV